MSAPTVEQLRIVVERACRHLTEAEGALLRAGLAPREPLSARQDASETENGPREGEAVERPAGGHTALRALLVALDAEAEQHDEGARLTDIDELVIAHSSIAAGIRIAVLRLLAHVDGPDAARAYMQRRAAETPEL